MQIVARFAGSRFLFFALLVALGLLAPYEVGAQQDAPAALPEVPLESDSISAPAFDPVTNGTTAAPVVTSQPLPAAAPREPFMPLDQARDEIRRAFVSRDYERVIDLGEKIEANYHVSSGSDYYIKLAQNRLESQANAESNKRPYRRLSDIPTSLDLVTHTPPAATTVAAVTARPADEQNVPLAQDPPAQAPDPAAPSGEVPDRVIAMVTPAPAVSPSFPIKPAEGEVSKPFVLEPITKQTARPLGPIIGLVLGLLVVIATVVLLVSRRRAGAELEPSGRINEDSPGIDDSFAVAGVGPILFEDEPSSPPSSEPLHRDAQRDDFESMFTIEPAPADSSETPGAAQAAPAEDELSPFEQMFDNPNNAFESPAPAAPEPFEPLIAQAPKFPSDHYDSFIDAEAPPVDESSIDFSGDTSTEVRDLPEAHDPFEDSGLIQLDDLMLRDEAHAPAPSEPTDLPMTHYDGPSIETMNTEFEEHTVAPLHTSFEAPPQDAFEAMPGAEFAFDIAQGGGDATETSISLPSIEDTADSTSTSELPSYGMPAAQSFHPDETVEIALQNPSSGFSQEETMGLEPETLPSIPVDTFSAQTQISGETGIEQPAVESELPPPPPPVERPAPASPIMPAPDYASPSSEDLFDREARMGESDFTNGNWAGAVHHFSIAAALRPEEQMIKERLREARRMRKDAQGN